MSPRGTRGILSSCLDLRNLVNLYDLRRVLIRVGQFKVAGINGNTRDSPLRASKRNALRDIMQLTFAKQSSIQAGRFFAAGDGVSECSADRSIDSQSAAFVADESLRE
jgi:hypothetical protein